MLDTPLQAVGLFICHVAYLLLRVVEQLAQKEKIDSFWTELSSESANIRLIEYRKSAEESRYQITANTDYQKNIVGKLDLYRFVPVSTTRVK